MIKFEVTCRARTPNDEFSICSLNNHTVLINFIFGICSHTFQAELLGAIAKLLQQREIVFFRQRSLKVPLLKVPSIMIQTTRAETLIRGFHCRVLNFAKRFSRVFNFNFAILKIAKIRTNKGSILLGLLSSFERTKRSFFFRFGLKTE